MSRRLDRGRNELILLELKNLVIDQPHQFRLVCDPLGFDAVRAAATSVRFLEPVTRWRLELRHNEGLLLTQLLFQASAVMLRILQRLVQDPDMLALLLERGSLGGYLDILALFGSSKFLV